MKLSDFEKVVPSSIVERGKEYYKNFHVVELEEIDDRFYRAEVEGSDYYEVRVQIDEANEIQFTSCDCPFDMEAICKHQVAVFLELRKYLSDTNANTKLKSSQAHLSDQLNALSKEQLVSLLVDYAQEMKEVKSRLEVYFMQLSENEDMNQYVKLIRTYAKRYAERDGFVSYRNVSRAVEGAEIVLEKAWEADDKGESVRAAQISFCVLHEMAKLMPSSDDSDGIIGGLIDQCLQLIATVVESEESLSPNVRVALLHTLLQAAQSEELTDWKLPLLEIAAGAAQDIEARRQWEDCVLRLELKQQASGQGTDSWIPRKGTLDLFPGGRN
ncbi:hypothetical protein A8990_11870 [Paenibacillus taihuensis]|uniref:SWIM-type domain-containing protein n=1 Tax=Paenibacillus taihuensis TaxID=1156355 RepID=A0A3D9RY07_9BACL|nr:SWIM zinc finger family protein [Paenibacillus taihuensis]REE81545.1 hypothetical protein A8990_11870 [Paenibacillus taihuensis]